MDRKWIKTALFGAVVLTATAVAAQAAETPVTRLGEVVVTASRAQESLREVTGSMTVINQEQIEASTANNMEELLSQNGFFALTQGTTKLVQIRGLSQPSMSNEMNSPILVLLNGHRIGANNVNLMGLANVERVEIIRGPSAVQYGPSAMGGVINIITKRGRQNDFEATLEGGLGSYGLHKESLAVNGGVEGFDFALGVINYGRQNYKAHNDKTFPKSAIHHNTNVNADLGYNFNEANRAGANINYYEFDGRWGEGFSARENLSSWGEYKLSNYNVAFMYDGGTLNRMFNWSAAYSFGRDEEKNKYLSSYGASKSKTTIDVQTANAQAGYNGDLASLDIGVDYTKYDFKGDWISKGDYKDLGLYFAGKLRLFEEKLIFSLGGRYDHFKISDDLQNWSGKEDQFSPSVGIAFLPAEWLKLRGNYSEGFKMPTPGQISGNGGQYAGNSGLKPEKSKTWEVGADVSWQFIDAGLTYFHTEQKDKIVASQIGSDRWQYKNLKAAQLAGLEFAFSADLGRAFNWQSELRPYVNFTYMLDRKNKDPNTKAAVNKVLNVPDWMVNFGLAFANTEYDLKANVNAVYTGKMKTQDYRGDWMDPGYGAYINHTGDLVVNASVEKGLFALEGYGSVKLRVDVNNIFDADNEAYFDYPGPGRNFYVGLKYVF